ncbi:MAG: NUDIX domain-containing protein [Patescibacteria group bacterium]
MKYVVGSKTVTLVNSQDDFQGEMDIFKAHEDPFHLHRASSVWLFRKKKEKRKNNKNFIQVLLQRRSKFKPIGAGQWGNGVCANVRPDENYEESAHRRLYGELQIPCFTRASQSKQDIKIDLKPVYKFEYKAYGNEKYSEHELDQVFIGEYDGEVLPNPDEVSEVIWVDWQELLAKILEKNDQILSAQESLKHSHKQLKRLAAPIKISINNRNIIIAPWTALMIIDPKLHKALGDLSA